MMRSFRSQGLVPIRFAAAWLALLGIAAMLAAYGATVAHAPWEVETTRWLQAASPGVLRAVAEFMTFIGRSPVSTLIPAIAILALWFSGRRWLSAFLALATLARVLSPVLKALVDRPRPSDSLVNVVYQLGDPSFPSGHVLGATLFYGFLIYCAELCIPGRTPRRLVQAGLVLAIGLMGYARVQLGAHWPTDVLGGYAVGLLILTAVIWLHRRVATNRPERPEPAPAGS
jgi:undecaprenyl-diphosphatase